MIFVAPQSHKELILNNNELVSIDGKECYSVIKGVPILLPEKINPDWSRELIEIIFWEHHDVISKIYGEIERDNVADWNEVYLKYIKEIHGTKENILKAFFKLNASCFDICTVFMLTGFLKGLLWGKVPHRS